MEEELRGSEEGQFREGRVKTRPTDAGRVTGARRQTSEREWRVAGTSVLLDTLLVSES